jgi:tetratricopeptide (TPR) repeat protein
MMRGFALALGVRCEHCHAPAAGAEAAAPAPAGGGGGGGRGGGGPDLDHALDDNETKKVAREMIKMVMDINQKYLPATGRTIDARNQVTCETCHHGLPRPQTLRAALAGAVEAKGADSAVALYRALRLRYFGSAAYDFSEVSLNESAAEVARMPNQRPAAIRLYRLNLEFYPQSVPAYQGLTTQLLQSGDTAAAVEVLTQAVNLVPNNQQLNGLLSRLRRPPGTR